MQAANGNESSRARREDFGASQIAHASGGGYTHYQADAASLLRLSCSRGRVGIKARTAQKPRSGRPSSVEGGEILQQHGDGQAVCGTCQRVRSE